MTDLVEPSHASIIFIRIQEFSRRPVADQAKLKSKLELLVARVVERLPPDGRIVLEAHDGAAIVIPAAPDQAFAAALLAESDAKDLPMCIGVNHGAIKIAWVADEEATLIGDGIVAAKTVADFAKPGRFFVSRAFRDALAESAPEAALTFTAAGTFTDDQVRTHELFAHDANAVQKRRRKLIAIGILGVVGILALGFAARQARVAIARSNQPAVIVFDVRPQVEIFIDGVPKGKTPPLSQIEVTPGKHTIQATYGKLPPLRMEVDLKPGEKMTVKHAFAGNTNTTKPKPGFFENLRRKLGGE